ncbi:MAG: hypothetical protein NZ938_07310 [Aigarchaeota archaeon]|nr:hypothetical protein [Candidatus Calditenuaceae archaeon]
MGRKRRKIYRRPVRAPPKVFTCPLCGAQAVTVTKAERFRAVVTCGKCGVSHEVPWLRSYMPIDAYSTWYDIVTGRLSSEAVKERMKRMEQAAAEVTTAETEVAVDEAAGADETEKES